jgi:hypothetical protein
MASGDSRKAFVVGAVLGAAAGTIAAFWNAPQSGHRTRTQIQQAVEGVLFKALDMTPFEPKPSDTVTETRPSGAAAATDMAPADVLIDSRPSEASTATS